MVHELFVAPSVWAFVAVTDFADASVDTTQKAGRGDDFECDETR